MEPTYPDKLREMSKAALDELTRKRNEELDIRKAKALQELTIGLEKSANSGLRAYCVASVTGFKVKKCQNPAMPNEEWEIAEALMHRLSELGVYYTVKRRNLHWGNRYYWLITASW